MAELDIEMNAAPKVGRPIGSTASPRTYLMKEIKEVLTLNVEARENLELQLKQIAKLVKDNNTVKIEDRIGLIKATGDVIAVLSVCFKNSLNALADYEKQMKEIKEDSGKDVEDFKQYLKEQLL